MDNQGGNFAYRLPFPTISLEKVFLDIKAMQRDNLEDMKIQQKDDKNDEEVRGLKFIAKKIKILLQKNKKVEYNEASRILISNFASEEKGQRNIKRRVYDAINVLVSAGVINKQDNKIELVPDRKIAKREKPSNEDRQTDLQNRVELKKKQVNDLRMRINLLKKMFPNKTKKQTQSIECKVVQWSGGISNVEFDQKKDKLRIILKGGKLLSEAENLYKFLCSTDHA